MLVTSVFICSTKITVLKTIPSLCLCANLLFTVFVYGQDVFSIESTGLTPEFSISQINALSQNQLYEETLLWIEENKKKYQLSIENKTENQVIQLVCVKKNAVRLDKQYFNAKYKLNIRFEEKQYKFEPTQIQLKLNSKYDMGWKDFDLSNGSIFFKKGKPIKKYKSYLEDVAHLLNELNLQLSAELNPRKTY